MHPVPTPTRRPRTQPSQRLRVTRQRQRGRRLVTRMDRRTPSGRLLARIRDLGLPLLLVRRLDPDR